MRKSLIKDILFSLWVTSIYHSYIAQSVSNMQKIIGAIVVFGCVMAALSSIDSFEKNLGRQYRRYIRLTSGQKKSASDGHPKCTRIKN